MTQHVSGPVSGPLAILTGGSTGIGPYPVGARFAAGQTLWVDGGVFTRAAWPYAQ
ncbi:hypothetical protein [Novosphingobium sp. SG707]|uniref:hypothetical protein n=1 Tax=Novosphingobium sp. SG707 TaxID=2586996 RepID=UPI0014461E31|nr:hypothetical protein [Novosphingobium sp. SG707]NKI98444.1 hypothetical protein [Novosphingobium sp. SG707]